MAPSPRSLLAVVLLAATIGACALDEAELVSPDADGVSADVGQFRVLRYRDDPGTDHWVDVVSPDPAVFEETTSFREEDSRAADDEDPADQRRLFHAVAPGRTLLVQMNCADCAGEPPPPGTEPELNVWDLVVGDPHQAFSPGTDVVVPGATAALSVGDVVVLAEGSGDIPESMQRPGRDGQRLPLERLGRHTPDQGADVFVEVYVARFAGESTVLFQKDDGNTVTYRFRVT